MIFSKLAFFFTDLPLLFSTPLFKSELSSISIASLCSVYLLLSGLFHFVFIYLYIYTIYLYIHINHQIYIHILYVHILYIHIVQYIHMLYILYTVYKSDDS
jgi:hypothetical protein